MRTSDTDSYAKRYLFPANRESTCPRDRTGDMRCENGGDSLLEGSDVGCSHKLDFEREMGLGISAVGVLPD